jgi:nucleotide-binding universal stress UspA family protein
VPSVAALLPAEVVEQRLSQTGAAQHRAQALFRRSVSPLPSSNSAFLAPAGNAIDAALVQARCADLAILGQPGEDGVDTSFKHRLAEQVMLGSGAPILMVPYAPATTNLGTNVLVAWDGGREASRAMHDALPMLGGAARVTVVSVTPDGESAERMTQSQKALANFLSAHAIDAEYKLAEGTGSEAGERLLSQAADIGADLIVMGGYGHARSRELVLGGATRTMIDAMTVPVLLSH